MKHSFLIVERYGDFLGGAWRLLQEGNDVKVYFADKKIGKDYKGIVPVADTVNEGLSGDNVIVVFAMTGNDKLAEEIKKAGYPVFGSAYGYTEEKKHLADELERNRIYGVEVALKAGIKVPETHYFDNAKEAYAFAKSTNDQWVLKPVGEAASNMTVVSKNRGDLLSELSGWADSPKEKDVPLILSKFIKGVEVNPECYVSSGRVLYPANVLFETKKLLNDDLGPSVGCGASTVFPYVGRRLTDQTIKKLEPFIKEHDITGVFDCNTIIDEKGDCWFIEFGPRMGYSAIYAVACLLGIPLGDFIAGVANGTLKQTPYKRGYAGSLRVSLPPYPFEPADEKLREAVYEQARGIEISGDPFKDPNTFPVEVYREGGKYKTMGLFGVVCEVAGFSPLLGGLWAKIRQKADALELPDKQYRTDNYEAVAGRIANFLGMGYGKAPERNLPQDFRAGKQPTRELSHV